jgi:glutathione S-transferase
MSSPNLTFFHCPQTRSTGVYTLLEELGAPFDMHVVSLRAQDNRKPEYLAVNPLGKVPAVRYGDAIVTEQVAIFIFLADLFPTAGLAPAIDDPLRGPYLRWLVYYAACFEPAIVDHHLQRDAAPGGMSPYRDYETVIQTIFDQLAKGPYLLGEKFSAADVLWGTALGWTTAFKLVPENEHVAAYVKRVGERPAAVKVAERDAAMAAELNPPAAT